MIARRSLPLSLHFVFVRGAQSLGLGRAAPARAREPVRVRNE